MKEIFGDAWELSKHFDILCITTNGMVKKDGSCVMGRGIAYEAKNRVKGIEFILGQKITESGNHVHALDWINDNYNSTLILSFPVKHNWYEKADIELIKRSCVELVERMNSITSELNVLLPRPGCGNGGLNWEDVKAEIEPLLDDRFTIVSFAEKE